MARAKTFVVERVRRSSVTKKAADPEPEPITVHSVNFSGSFEQCVRITFSVNLTEEQRNFVESKVWAHECQDTVHDIRWSDRRTVVVEVRRNSLGECARIDVERAVRLLATEIPTKLR